MRPLNALEFARALSQRLTALTAAALSVLTIDVNTKQLHITGIFFNCRPSSINNLKNHQFSVICYRKKQIMLLSMDTTMDTEMRADEFIELEQYRKLVRTHIDMVCQTCTIRVSVD